MSELTSEIIWAVAAFCTTISFVPQALRTIRTKDTKWLSLKMYVMFTIWVFLWLIYWILLIAYPIIIANFITLILAGTILGYKIKYK